MWIELPHCQTCQQKFSVTTRKHHWYAGDVMHDVRGLMSCSRHCGRIVCAKCSPESVAILKLGEKKKTRVCQDCFEVLSSTS